MSARPLRAAFLLIVLLVATVNNVWAQGFAGLGTTAEGFEVPQVGRPLVFPGDFGAHPNYRIEWWYLTANLKGADGKDYGVQWTLFRSALAPGEKPGWDSSQIWMGNAAVTTANHQYVAERLARGGIGQAGVTAAPFSSWIDDWAMTANPSAPDVANRLGTLSIGAAGADFSYALKLAASTPLVKHGQGGYSVKSASGQASFYYSQPSYSVTGMLNLPTGDVPVTGSAWLDREWSSQPLAADQTGWDWFSLHLGTGEKLMAFRLRDSGRGFTSGTRIAADGTSETLSPDQLTLTPKDTAQVEGRKIPVSWQIDIPSHGLSITTAPINAQSWMSTSFPYWEGPVTFRGSHTGSGYLEMTGYR
jgi:predicted secreted hydrolase